MEIKNVLQRLTDPYRTQATEKEKEHRGRAVGKDVPGSGDRVSVSGEARLCTEAYSTALATPEVRRDRVEALRQRIAAGEYAIDARDIAQKLLENDTEFARSLS